MRIQASRLLRKLTATFAMSLVAGTSFTALQAVAPNTSEIAAAADMSGFQAGNIIDDSLFFNGYSMGVGDVQSFLNGKVSSCRSGYTCLKDYAETTNSIAANPMCSQYVGAANESAAAIITKVGQACGISPKVLLVTLQKEQGLVTDTWPTSSQYRAAMGALCPDTAPCDSTAAGFFKQVYTGAYLLKRYTQPTGTGAGTEYSSRFDLSYPVGQTSNVLYNPNSNCGTRSVYIQNQATHVLYVYTPYTPNAAALATSYQVGDSCSSYGNRNFYSYYTDWFGSVRGFEVGSYFQSYYAANSSWLGYAAGPMTCGGPDSGCFQQFQFGLVAGSYSTAAAGVKSDFLSAWSAWGREYGPFGYPTSGQTCDLSSNYCRQTFQGGWIITSPTGLHVVWENVRALWSNWGREYGPFGWPVTDRYCEGSLCFQKFNGAIAVINSAGTAYFVPENVRALWSAWGREYGPLGTPTSSPSANPTSGNYTQTFTGGTVTVTSGTATITSFTDPWYNAPVANASWIGSPTTSSKSCTLGGGACYQGYSGGWIVQNSSGVFAVPTGVLNLWSAWGREYGPLGTPTSSPSANPTSGNYTQTFTGGTVTVTSGTATITSFTDPWYNAPVANASWIGSPTTSSKSCTLGGGACYQGYSGGWIVQNSSGVFAVPTGVLNLWSAWGREYGPLGTPTSSPSANPTSGNYTQAFTGGTVTLTSGTATITSFTDSWYNTVHTNTWLGSQTNSKSCTLKWGMCYQSFQNGWVVAAGLAYTVPENVRVVWSNWGREYGPLGFPNSNPSASPTTGNYTQTFQGGIVSVVNNVAVLTSSTDPWVNAVLTTSWLGASTSNQACTLKDGGCVQTFANGWIVQKGQSVFVVPDAVRQLWSGWGREYGDLGWPTTNPVGNVSSGNYTQSFQGGTVTVTSGVAAR